MMMTQWAADMYRNLATLLGAGVNVRRALEVEGKSLAGRPEQCLRRLEESVRNGGTLTQGLRKCGSLVAPVDLMLVEVGEESGNLPECLKRLAEWHEFQGRMRRATLQGLIYPLAILHVAVLVLPAVSVLSGALGLAEYVGTVVGLLAGLVWLPLGVLWAVRKWWPGQGGLRRGLDTVLGRVPLLGRGLCEIALSRYCGAFHMLLRAGTPAISTAEKSTAAAAFWPVQREVAGAADAARRGVMFWEGFGVELPAEFIESWRIGEESGALDDTVARLEQHHADLGEALLRSWAVWFPRVVYVAVVLITAVMIVRAFLNVLGGGLS